MPPTATRPPRNALELLERQERLARRGLRRTSHRIGAELDGALDLEQHVRRHPALSLGVAAGAGLALGPGIVRLLTRPARIVRLAGKVAAPLGRGVRLAVVGSLVSWIRGPTDR